MVAGNVASCPDCGQQILLGSKVQEGQRVRCSKCDAHLEIICLKPPGLDWVFESSLRDSDPDREADAK